MASIHDRLYYKLLSSANSEENYFTWIPKIFHKEYIEDDGNRKALEMAKKFTRKETNKGLYIYGGVGVGKSHLATGIILNWCKQNKTNKAEFINFPSLLFELQSNFNDKEEAGANESIISDLIETELLVLDDIGGENTTKWSNTILYLIVNGRYENKKPIVVTTNLNPKKLSPNVGDKIVSRLCQMCEVVKITSEDRRIKS